MRILGSKSIQLKSMPMGRPGRFFLVALLILVLAISVRLLDIPFAAQLVSATIADPVNVTGNTRQSIQLRDSTRAAAEAEIQQAQAQIRANPDDVDTYTYLGMRLLELVRETGDAALYERAGVAFDAALTRDPQNVEALTGQGVLALALHDFDAALELATRAHAMNPYRAEIIGIQVDALVELGRYPEAIAAAQAMVNLRPGLSAYSRVAYVRELHGLQAGAIEAMRAAVDAGMPGTEARAWANVQLGNLYFKQGDLTAAGEAYAQTLRERPDYPFAEAGLARIQAAQGDFAGAIVRLEKVIARMPLPEFVILLGEIYLITGDMAQAEAQWELVRVFQQLNAAAGMDVDLELAFFAVEYGANAEAAQAMAQATYTRRPTIFAADTLAWAYFHTGQLAAAERTIQEALALGTQDALLYYHAGRIALATGDEAAAHRYLTEALALNPYFSLIHAPQARLLLEQLGE